MDFVSLLSITVTIFLLLITGIVADKLKIIDEVSTKKLSTLIVKIGQPMLTISALIKLDCTPEMLKQGMLVFLLGVGTHILMGGFAFGFSRMFRDVNESKITEFSIVFTNCGFIGFPIAKALIGDIGLFYGAFYMMGFYVFLWSWGLAIMARKRDDIKITPLKAVINIGTIPCFIGVAVLAVGIKLPSFVGEYTNYLASLCTPVSILVTGALISRKTPKELFSDWRIYAVSAFKLIVVPIAVGFIAKLIGLPEYMVIFSTIMAAMPSAAVTSMFGELYDVAPKYAAHLVGMSSIFCTATIPAVMFVLQEVILKI